jgi:hypothetical protein
MRKASLFSCVCVGCLVSLTGSVWGQEVIHALTGSVISINQETKVITVLQDNGSRAEFQGRPNPKTRIAFDKSVADGTVAAEQFKQQGAYSIVFYYGNTSEKMAVALKDLGAGPFESVEGTVAKFDAHGHSLSVQDSAGSVQTIRLTSDTVVESNFGAVDGLKFQAQKGDHVRVVAVKADGAANALFVKDN